VCWHPTPGARGYSRARPFCVGVPSPGHVATPVPGHSVPLGPGRPVGSRRRGSSTCWPTLGLQAARADPALLGLAVGVFPRIPTALGLRELRPRFWGWRGACAISSGALRGRWRAPAGMCWHLVPAWCSGWLGALTLPMVCTIAPLPRPPVPPRPSGCASPARALGDGEGRVPYLLASTRGDVLAPGAGLLQRPAR